MKDYEYFRVELEPVQGLALEALKKQMLIEHEGAVQLPIDFAIVEDTDTSITLYPVAKEN
jgi:hypothetical protein